MAVFRAGGAVQVVIVSASPLLIRPKQSLTLQVCKLPRTARTLQLVHAVGVGDLDHAVVRGAAGPVGDEAVSSRHADGIAHCADPP